MIRFTVIERGNCVLIEGALPMAWFSTIVGHMPKEAVASPDLARMLGCTFAFGLPTNVDALIASLKPAADTAAVASASARGLSEAAARWLASGERGTSSNTIFTILTGVDALDGWSPSYPVDPSDFRRCRLLLEQCPEVAEQFPRMASASKMWAALVRDWNAICAAMNKEMPDWRDPKRGAAPETYRLIKLATGLK
jgi:hypothetical protein